MTEEGGRVADAPGVVLEALARVAAKRGVLKPRYHVKPGSEAGDGFIGTIFKATIEGEEPGAPPPLSVVCKITPPDPSNLVRLFFAVEGFVYENVLGVLEEVAHFTDPLPWPRSFLVSVGGAAGQQPDALVLEELRGFAMWDRAAPLDLTSCSLLLRALARLHGAGMALEALRPDAFAPLRDRLRNPYDTPEMRFIMEPLVKACLEVPDIVSDRFPRGSAVHAKLEKLFKGFADDYVSFMGVDPEGGNTILHGDCYVNNFMFQFDNKGEVPVTKAVRIIDFQTACYGAATADVMILLLASTDKALRAAHWDALLRIYHDELHATLREAGVEDPDAVFSWDRYQAQLRRTSLCGLGFAPVVVHCLEAEGEALEQLGECFQAKLEDGVKQKKLRLAVTPKLKRHVEDVVEDMERWGWLPS